MKTVLRGKFIALNVIMGKEDLKQQSKIPP